MTFLFAVMFLGQAAAATPPTSAVLPFEAERLNYRVAVGGMVTHRRFAELESQVRALRTSRERFSSGVSKLYDFYRGLNPPGETAQPMFVDPYEVLLKGWQAQFPDSITPRNGLIRLERLRAFTARGLEFAPKVTAGGWQGFEEHMKRAWQLADSAMTLKEKDPEFFSLLIDLCKSGGCPREKVEGFLKAGLALDPTYDGLYVDMANYVLPRWQGSVDEFTRFAARAADESRRHLGEIAYVRVATVALLTEGSALPDRYPGLSWKRIQQGLADLDQRFPGSARTHHLRARFACAYHDAGMARAAFNALGGPAWSLDAAAIWNRKERLQECFDTSRGVGP